jgi:hypothetical protein
MVTLIDRSQNKHAVQAYHWCLDKFGQEATTYNMQVENPIHGCWCIYYGVFSFINDEDAAYFKLVWL